MTMHHNAETDEYDDDAARGKNKSIFSSLKDMFLRGDEEEDAPEEPSEAGGVAAVPAPIRSTGGSAAPLRRGNGSTLRLETVRRTHVTVRRTVQSFEDVRRAIDALREGTQQIVNLEQTPADMSGRLIDFLNGATYAIDGAVEKIGEQVYLFTPPNVTVNVEDKPVGATTRASIFDRD